MSASEQSRKIIFKTCAATRFAVSGSPKYIKNTPSPRRIAPEYDYWLFYSIRRSCSTDENEWLRGSLELYSNLLKR
jgi:hypothetical protein